MGTKPQLSVPLDATASTSKPRGSNRAPAKTIERPTTLDLGANAEQRAVELLCDHHYEIVERNWRTKAGEIDIVARPLHDRSILVFVEVRSRADDTHGTALEMVSPRKQRQVIRVATHYLLEKNPHYEQIRFDVVAITGGDAVLIQDAYRSGLRVF